MTIKDKIMIYIYHKSNEIEQDMETLQIQSRFAPLDSLDHFELMHSKARLNAWKEFIDDIYKIVINCK